MPPQVIPAKKPSQAGIWAALGVLVVFLGVGAWYFTEHKSSSDTVPPGGGVVNPPVEPNPHVTPPQEPTNQGTNPGQDKGTNPQDASGGTPAEKPEEPPKRRTQDFVQPKPPVVTPKPQPVEPPKPVVDTKRVNASLKMGQFYFDRGEYEKAIEEFQQGLSLDPSNAELRNSIARAKKAKQAEDLLNQ